MLKMYDYGWFIFIVLKHRWRMELCFEFLDPFSLFCSSDDVICLNAWLQVCHTLLPNNWRFSVTVSKSTLDWETVHLLYFLIWWTFCSSVYQMTCKMFLILLNAFWKCFSIQRMLLISLFCHWCTHLLNACLSAMVKLICS